MIELTKFW